MKALLISGNTLTDWDVNDILQDINSKNRDIERLLQYEYDNTIGPETARQGLTYLEVEQINYNYNF